ncbi:unnamed protein product [Lactuca virosa]|uniref:Protein kinase domain-containing protein n=1 Tax=Lactuca virosa TaxID=75947 RepID=A0AAU9PHA2_9ASTR|nr:unnamed protein product [Lactuca virosa]
MRRILEAAPPAALVLNQESPSAGGHSSSAIFFFLAGLIVLLLLVILAFVFRKFIRPSHLKKLIKRKDSNKAGKDYLSGNLRTISYFSFQALKKATKNFHESNLLGKGGFGPVYLGKLEDGAASCYKEIGS